MHDPQQDADDSVALDAAYLYGDVQVPIDELAARARKEVEDARRDDGPEN